MRSRGATVVVVNQMMPWNGDTRTQRLAVWGCNVYQTGGPWNWKFENHCFTSAHPPYTLKMISPYMNCVPAFTAVCSSLEVWNTWANAVFAWSSGMRRVPMSKVVGRCSRRAVGRDREEIWQRSAFKRLWQSCYQLFIFFACEIHFLSVAVFQHIWSVHEQRNSRHNGATQNLSHFLIFTWHGTGNGTVGHSHFTIDFRVTNVLEQM